MRSAEDVKDFVKKIKIKTNPTVNKAVLNDLLGRIDDADSEFANTRRPKIWSKIMKSNITKSAAAAIIVIGAFIFLTQGNGISTALAWEDVLEQVYKAKTVTYKHKVESVKLKLNQISTTMQMEPGLIRTESSNANFISLHDYTSGTSMFLNPQIKTAEIRHYINSKMSASIRNSYEWLKTLHRRDVQFVGEEMIDGSTYNVYMGEDPFSRTTVWVDPGTNLPAKVLFETVQNTSIDFIIPEITLSETDFGAEIKIVTGKDGKINASGMSTLKFSAKNYACTNGFGIQDKLTITYYDFDWNTELDKSLFRMIPPENYKVEERTVDVSKVLKGEDALVHALDFWVTASNNTFPYSFDNLCDPNVIKPMIIETFNKDGNPKEEWQAACREAEQIFRGFGFALEKKSEGTWGYAGQGVELGDAESIVCWWFDEELESYKAIFGDLSIREVTEDQLPAQP